MSLEYLGYLRLYTNRAFVGGTLVKKALEGCHLEAVVLMLPQFIDRPLPILVGAFCLGVSPKKNRPPGQFWRQ